MRNIKTGWAIVLLGSSLLLDSAVARGQTAASLSVTRIATGFSRPLYVTAPPGDSNRLFIVEQHSGRIRILDLETKVIRPEPFLRVTGVTQGGEQGLLGLAFHPGYATNGFFYVNYTTPGIGPAGHTEIVRFQANGEPAAAATADPASKTILLTYPQPAPNHNGGWAGFGNDGYLYISSGDGGGGDDQFGTIGNGQNRAVLLGKILRIDVDGGVPYSIPDGNPFKGMTEFKEEIWAFGLRNPWRCSFDRLTGDLWIGDVGQNTREEIDFVPAGTGGLNFGWRPREGAIQNPRYPNEDPVTTAIAPVHDYPRSLGYSVTGGYVYRGQAIPSLQGTYLFADYGTARFWSLRYDGLAKSDVQERTTELNPGSASTRPIRGPSSFGEDPAGELYICDLDDGEIFKIVAKPPTAITLKDATVSENVFQFTFGGVPGQNYVIESRDAFPAGAWQTFTNLTVSASGTNVIVSDLIGNSQRYYRVRAP